MVTTLLGIAIWAAVFAPHAGKGKTPLIYVSAGLALLAALLVIQTTFNIRLRAD